MVFPYKYYSRICALILLGAPGLLPVDAAELVIESGPGRIGSLIWQDAELRYVAGENQQAGWTAELSDLRIVIGSEPEQILERAVIECPSPRSSDAVGQRGPRPMIARPCEGGELSWETPYGQVGRAELALLRRSGELHFDLRSDAFELSGVWSLQANKLAGLSIDLDGFDISPVLPILSTWVDLDVLYGQISGRLRLSSNTFEGEWAIEGAGFDGDDGQVAGDGLGLTGSVSGRIDSDQQSLTLNLTQGAGELLIGPLYLPAPGRPIEAHLDIVRRGPGEILIDRLHYHHPDVAAFNGAARLLRRDQGWQAAEVELFDLDADLERVWPRWIDGLASTVGFADLSSRGQLSASARLLEGELAEVDLSVEAFELTDPRGRFDLEPTRVRLRRDAPGLDLDLAMDGLMLYGLPFGPSDLRAGERGGVWVLLEPLRLPLLGGAVVIDRFDLDPGPDAGGVTLDARIEPLSLEQLTQTLGWPEFGGQLSGDFPGIVFRDDRLDVTGAINVNAFSGQIRLSELVIERPLGSLPALAAQVEIDRLDLQELTGAFNFGRMEGEVSGWMRDLRLLDWRPVAMDTRLFTHDDVPRRRISQRAVDNLSNLGGGLGGALIGNTILRLFEDFPYRRAGLACRLSNNICHIDGVAEHEPDGFYIVEGRGLPRLDIIGHRRLVDWPRLVSQLAAATR